MSKVDKNRPVSSIRHEDKRAAIPPLLLSKTSGIIVQPLQCLYTFIYYKYRWSGGQVHHLAA